MSGTSAEGTLTAVARAYDSTAPKPHLAHLPVEILAEVFHLVAIIEPTTIRDELGVDSSDSMAWSFARYSESYSTVFAGCRSWKSEKANRFGSFSFSERVSQSASEEVVIRQASTDS